MFNEEKESLALAAERLSMTPEDLANVLEVWEDACAEVGLRRWKAHVASPARTVVQ